MNLEYFLSKDAYPLPVMEVDTFELLPVLKR